MKKNIIAVALCFTLCLCAAGCASAGPDNMEDEPNAAEIAEIEMPEDITETTATEAETETDTTENETEEIVEEEPVETETEIETEEDVFKLSMNENKAYYLIDQFGSYLYDCMPFAVSPAGWLRAACLYETDDEYQAGNALYAAGMETEEEAAEWTGTLDELFPTVFRDTEDGTEVNLSFSFAEPFNPDNTYIGTFHAEDGLQLDTQFMHGIMHGTWYEDDVRKTLAVPAAEDDITIVFYYGTVRSLEEGISLLKEDGEEAAVDVTIPRYGFPEIPDSDKMAEYLDRIGLQNLDPEAFVQTMSLTLDESGINSAEFAGNPVSVDEEADASFTGTSLFRIMAFYNFGGPDEVMLLYAQVDGIEGF